jgi:hypothetical protein
MDEKIFSYPRRKLLVQGGDRRGGGVNESLIKFFHKNSDICPMFKIPSKKPLKESDEKY